MVQESTNTFSDGLISDLSSLTTPNTVLTDALNATLLTFNGNELVLQNDMGNTKIMVPGTELDPEYVQLPEGFIPIGMKEHGGVLYIVSTNGTFIEIGSFPSLPEGAMETLYKTKLTVATNNSAITSISVENTTNFPTSGIILIGETSVTYTSKTSTSFTFVSTVIPTYAIGTEVSVTSALVHITGTKYLDINYLGIDLGKIVNGVAINLNKNFIISDKLNSGEKFLIVLNTENLNTISEFNGVKKYYKPKLLSIEKGIETDITNTLSLQEKKNGGSFVATNYWFLPLTNSEYSTFNKADYINNKKYQIYKPKKGGTLALRFELETINSFTLEKLEIVGNNLQFDFKIFGDSLIKPNKVNLSYKFTDINTGVQSSLTTATPNTTFSFNVNNIATPSISISLIDYLLNPPTFNLNRIIEFTATCENTTYGIEFDKFVIKRSVDLSKESLNWEPTILYKVENISYSSNGVVTQIIIAKYGDINEIVTPMDRYNQPCTSSENQAAYYWNLLPDGANNSLITDKKYDIVGTFVINNSTKKAEAPITISTNENPLSSSNPNNLPQDILIRNIGFLYNEAVVTNVKSLVVGNVWRYPDYNDLASLYYTINNTPENLLEIGSEWNNLGTNLTGFKGLNRGMILLIHGNEEFYKDNVSWYCFGTPGTLTIEKVINVIQSSLEFETQKGQGSGIRLCTDTINPPNYIDADNNEYSYVKIGNLYWLTEDLRSTKFNDNTPLTAFTSTFQGWRDACEDGIPSYTNLTVN